MGKTGVAEEATDTEAAETAEEETKPSSLPVMLAPLSVSGGPRRGLLGALPSLGGGGIPSIPSSKNAEVAVAVAVAVASATPGALSTPSSEVTITSVASTMDLVAQHADLDNLDNLDMSSSFADSEDLDMGDMSLPDMGEDSDDMGMGGDEYADMGMADPTDPSLNNDERDRDDERVERLSPLRSLGGAGAGSSKSTRKPSPADVIASSSSRSSSSSSSNNNNQSESEHENEEEEDAGANGGIGDAEWEDVSYEEILSVGDMSDSFEESADSGF